MTYWTFDNDSPTGVDTLIPALSFRRSECVDFGGYVVSEPDLRPLEVLQKEPLVKCLKMNEGGAGIRIVPGSLLLLFATEIEALNALI